MGVNVQTDKWESWWHDLELLQLAVNRHGMLASRREGKARRCGEVEEQQKNKKRMKKRKKKRKKEEEEEKEEENEEFEENEEKEEEKTAT